MIHLISCPCFITKGETEVLADVTRHLWANQLYPLRRRKLTVVTLVVVVLAGAAMAERAGEVPLHLVAGRQLGIVRGVGLARQRVVFT